MQRIEYKVIPAPTRGLKARGLKSPEARFANALEQEMNALAAEGWQYVRADTLPSEERQGLTGSATHYRNVLVFCRPIQSDASPTIEPAAALAAAASPMLEAARDIMSAPADATLSDQNGSAARHDTQETSGEAADVTHEENETTRLNGQSAKNESD